MTAFDVGFGNTFLGYSIEVDNKVNIRSRQEKKKQGVIWGKNINHFDGRQEMLITIAEEVSLITTSTQRILHHKNIIWKGHLTPQDWLLLLAESKFLIGLGDPLLGPSAMDAISVGCMYLNPIYDTPVRDGLFYSQHSYAADKIGEPYVCSYHIKDKVTLKLCVEKALRTNLSPYTPPEFTKEVYQQRVASIFHLD